MFFPSIRTGKKKKYFSLQIHSSILQSSTKLG
jgi:hypothetical protein